MGEAVRLVVWDLDGVFWNGALSEGGASFVEANAQAVIALARRGIVSSICSHNDPAPVRALLTARGLWDYFVFPDLGFAPKGPRLAALIAAAQLRAASVLFIDDEPANREEAAHYAPGVQVAGPEILPLLLADPRLAGRPDPACGRLAQYKMLETRHAAAAGGDNLAFLRESGIEVRIDYDVAARLDRAIELINRTNQLNFTKLRLPEERETARALLAALLAEHDVFAGLVHVRDRFGDYGPAGLFLLKGQRAYARMVYFCFSCRLLNMGVERFIHAWLGRPAFAVAGPVACDLADAAPVDWIRFGAEAAELAPPAAPVIDRLVLRGGCDLDAMSHYLRALARQTHVEVNTARHGRQFRIDNIMFLDLIFGEMPDAVRSALLGIGYVPADWNSALAAPVTPRERVVWICSFWTDSSVFLYKHRTLDVAVPFLMQTETYANQDVTAMAPEAARGIMTLEENWRAWEALRRDFWGIGPVFEDLVARAIGRLAAAAQGRALVILVLAPESWRGAPRGEIVPWPKVTAYNRWLRAACAGREAFELVEFGDFVPPEAMYEQPFHYDRLSYMRAAAHIAGLIRARFGGGD